MTEYFIIFRCASDLKKICMHIVLFFVNYMNIFRIKHVSVCSV